MAQLFLYLYLTIQTQLYIQQDVSLELFCLYFSETGSSTQTAKPFVIGHPKMEKLQTIVLEHFHKMTSMFVFISVKQAVAHRLPNRL